MGGEAGEIQVLDQVSLSNNGQFSGRTCLVLASIGSPWDGG